MKLAEIPGLMDWIKTLPQQWLDDPEGWEMENWYLVRPDGVIAGEGGTIRLALRELCHGNKAKLAYLVKIAAKKAGAAAVVQATEGWFTKLIHSGLQGKLSDEEILECYGDSPEAKKNRERLGLERTHGLIILAQTDEETYTEIIQAWENPKALGEILQEGITTTEMDGTFANLLK